MRLTGSLLVVLGSAALYAASFPPAARRGLAWIALTPLLIVLRHGPTHRALGLAWLWTVAAAYAVNDWFPRAVSGYFHQPAVIGAGLFLGVSTFTAAVDYMGFALLQRRVARWPLALRPLITSAAWVAADVARVHLPGGDPWAIAGYSQVGADRLVQIADVAGVYGVTFLVVLVNAAVAEAWSARRCGRRAIAVAWIGPAVLLPLSLAYGAYKLGNAADPIDAPSRVGIVQANLSLGSQWKREFYGRNLEAYLAGTLAMLRERHPSLIVWPESAMTFFVSEEPAYRASIASVLSPFDAELIAGGPYSPAGTSAPFYNAAFHIGPDGGIRGRYDKQELLPFAEYLPLGRIDLLRRRFGRVNEFTPGDGAATPLRTRIGAIGVITCNEGFFPEPAAARVRDGATVLVNLSNDSWLGDTKYSAPAFDMVTLRAVEQRRWLVRASTAGPSAFIDPFGRVHQRTAMLTPATLVGEVTVQHDVTIYNRVGDVFAWFCVVVALLATVAAPRTPRAPLRRS